MDDDLTDTVINARASRSTWPDPGTGELLDEETVIRSRPESPFVASEKPARPVDAVTRHPYRFSLNGQPPLSTATATIVGRSPQSPRLPDAITPRLLTVSSPLSEVSATHLEVRQQGASVVVTDLRSTNGTVVTAPGSTPVRLRPGESYVAVPGSLVDIGDGNIIEILAMDRMSLADLDGRGRVDS